MRGKIRILVLGIALCVPMLFFGAAVLTGDNMPPGEVVVILPGEENGPGEMEGKIDRIAAREIVIDDSLYRYSDKIKFISYNGDEVSLYFFSKGDRVVYELDGKERVLLLRKK